MTSEYAKEYPGELRHYAECITRHTVSDIMKRCAANALRDYADLREAVGAVVSDIYRQLEDETEEVDAVKVLAALESALNSALKYDEEAEG